MKSTINNRIAVSFPGELEYIPQIRKLVSDMLLVLDFNPKFVFRSEFIVDELCNNAVHFGTSIASSAIDFICDAFEDRVEFTIKDHGGSSENRERLRLAVAENLPLHHEQHIHDSGLELLRLLAEKVDFSIGKNVQTRIHVVHKREIYD